MFWSYHPAGGDDREDSPGRESPRSETGPAGRRRPLILFLVGFAAVTIAVMTWPAIDPGLNTFYDRTIATQAGRDSPFSIWGQTSLEPLRIILLAATGALSLLFAFIPKRKSLIQLAALSAALLILLQLTLHHWFYLYIVWFYPLFLVAIAVDGSRYPSACSTPAEDRLGGDQTPRQQSVQAGIGPQPAPR